MVLVNLLIAILGTYGISTLVSEYDGLGNIFLKIRSMAVPKPFVGVFDCNVCLSVYVAVLFAIGLNIGLFGYLATIGGVIILSKL